MYGKWEVNYGNNLHWGLEVSGILLETCCPLEMSNLPGKGQFGQIRRKGRSQAGWPVSRTSVKVRLAAFLELGLAFLFSSTHNPLPCPCRTKGPQVTGH